jgi:hypothetical protein
MAHSKQDESIFIFGMVGIEELNRVLVKKDRTSFFERNPMLLPI